MHVAGVIVPQAASADPVRRAGRKRSSPSAAFRRGTKAASGPQPARLLVRNPMPGRHRRVRGNPMRANAMAVTPRGLASNATTAATSVPTRRAGIHPAVSGRPSNVTIARRALTVTRRALQGALPIRNSGRNLPTPREAKVSGKTATARSVRGRKAIGLMARVRRARAVARSALMSRAGIALPVTESFHAVRRIVVRAGRARSSATVRNVANPSLGRSAMPARAMIAAAQGVHGSRNRGMNVLRAASVARARLIVRKASVRASIARDRIVLQVTVLATNAMRGRNARAGRIATIARAVTMRTTARSSRNARRSVGAAPIGSAGLTTTAAARGRSRSRRRPASASRK